jgi:diguanylate cyclase (GGDEF)-like protein
MTHSHDLDGLNSAAMALLLANGLEDIAHVVVHQGSSLLGSEAAALVTGDPFAADAQFHLHDDGNRLQDDLVAELAQQTYQSGIAERLVASLSYGDGMAPALAATDFRSSLCFPLRSQEHYLGTLLLFRTDQRPDYTGDDLRLGMLYGTALALALENVRLVGKFHAQAVIDEVTGLYSRRYLFETLWQLVKRLTRSTPPVLTCMGVGIDDGEGLQARLDRGEMERLIKRVARVLGRTVRASDIVARSGQTDFIVLLPQTDIPGGRLVADKIRAAIASEITDPHPVSVSIGIAGYDFSDKQHVRSMKDASDLSGQLLHWAEAALREAQIGGWGNVFIWKD